MKNILFVDGADNCAYSVYSVSESVFRDIFPGKGQDVEFAEDLVKRLSKGKAAKFVAAKNKPPLIRSEINGIHGILFFGLTMKKRFYPNKRESDMDMTFEQRTKRANS